MKQRRPLGSNKPAANNTQVQTVEKLIKPMGERVINVRELRYMGYCAYERYISVV